MFKIVQHSLNQLYTIPSGKFPLDSTHLVHRRGSGLPEHILANENLHRFCIGTYEYLSLRPVSMLISSDFLSLWSALGCHSPANRITERSGYHTQRHTNTHESHQDQTMLCGIFVWLSFGFLSIKFCKQSRYTIVFMELCGDQNHLLTKLASQRCSRNITMASGPNFRS